MNKRYKVLFVFLLMVLFPVAMLAADATIKGTVTDAKTGDALPGANIIIKGTVKGTILAGYKILWTVFRYARRPV